MLSSPHATASNMTCSWAPSSRTAYDNKLSPELRSPPKVSGSVEVECTSNWAPSAAAFTDSSVRDYLEALVFGGLTFLQGRSGCPAFKTVEVTPVMLLEEAPDCLEIAEGAALAALEVLM